MKANRQDSDIVVVPAVEPADQEAPPALEQSRTSEVIPSESAPKQQQDSLTKSRTAISDTTTVLGGGTLVGWGDNAAAGPVQATLIIPVIPILFIVFYALYGDSWGEGKSAEDADCAPGFPIWMLAMGIIGVACPFAMICLQLFNNWNEGIIKSGVLAIFLLFIALVLILGYLAWWIYGQILLFGSEEDCGKELWLLAFVCFWIYVSCFGCCCILLSLTMICVCVANQEASDI